MHTYLIQSQSPVVLSVPHDGMMIIPGAGKRLHAKPRDLGTLPFALTLQMELHSLGVEPTLVWFALHRSQVDPNREDPAQACVPWLENEFNAFHETLDHTLEPKLERFGQCLLLDFHRCSFLEGPDIILGSDHHRTSQQSLDRVLARHLRPTYSVAFSPDPTLGIDSRYRGGWIIRRAAKRFGNLGLDAVQIELNQPLWDPHRLSHLSHDLAHAIAQTVVLPRLTATHDEKQAPF